MLSMIDEKQNPVGAIFFRINSILGEDKCNLPGRVSKRTVERWLTGWPLPTPVNAKHIALKIWDDMQSSAKKDTMRAVLACIREVVPLAPRKWNREKFGAWFFAQAEAARESLPQKPRKKTQPIKPTPAPMPGSLEKPFNSANPVHVRVNQLFADAGFPVFNGVVSCGPDVQVHLGPLYAYVEGLQSSAEVSNPFVAGKTMQLDALYVELTAAEDQRSRAWSEEGCPPSTFADADRPTVDPIGHWRDAIQRHRIPLETLISRTECLPAVLFGDPGSGKSTLTQYALHALGRGLVTGHGLNAANAIPFRLSLREFALSGKEDDYAIVPHLVRCVLRVPPETFENWRTLLAHFFHGEKPQRLFLLVDGVDEITLNPHVFSSIRRRLEEMTAVARLLITSRRAGFQAPVRRFMPFELAELSDLAMHGLIQNWFRQVSPRSEEFAVNFECWLSSDPRREEMATNPCLLSLLCFLNQNRAENHFTQAVNRADLYSQAVEKLTSDYDRLASASLPEALDALAGFSLDRYLNLGQGHTPQVLFRVEEARHFLHRCRSGQLAPALAPTTALSQDVGAVWLRTRLISRWDVDRWLHFIHLSFQEYFAAVWLTRLPPPEVKTLITLHRYNPFWREVWRFYAGLCRDRGAEGAERFQILARSFVQPCDFYEQSFFWLAQLCSDYGLRDTRLLLGFDLRAKLYQYFLSGRASSKSKIRCMADLDPDYFLDVVRQVLDQLLQFYQDAPCHEPPPPSEEISLAVDILQHIYHPEALRYQLQLIEAETRYPNLMPHHPETGPQISTGRNTFLSKPLEEWLETTNRPLQRRRLVAYLACARGPRAGQVIFEAGRRECRRAQLARPDEKLEVLDFVVACVWSLTDLQDVRAVELAAELWPVRALQGDCIFQVCWALKQIKSPAVPDLMERWLDEGIERDGETFLVILDLLKEWPERPVPAAIDQVLVDEKVGPRERAAAWEVVVLCGGHEGRKRLQNQLARWADQPCFTEAQVQELFAICKFVGALKLPFLEEIDKLRQQAEHNSEPSLTDALWACLTRLYSVDSRLPSHHRWLKDTCLPALRQSLVLKHSSGDFYFREWLDAFRSCPTDILRTLANMIEEVWSSLAKDLRGKVLHFFVDLPALAPHAIVRTAAQSNDTILYPLALRILADLEPGLLVMARKRHPGMDMALREKGERDGTLFFPTEYYSPEALVFHRYTGIETRAKAVSPTQSPE